MTDTPRPRRHLGRKSVVLGALALAAALAFGATTQTWYVYTLRIPAVGGDTVTVAGTAATSAMTALSLAALAATAALAIAGRRARAALAVLGILLGAGVVYATFHVMADPIRAGAAPITAKTGIAGAHALARLVDVSRATPWPYVALAAGVLLAAASLGVLVDSRRWPAPSKRYGENTTSRDVNLAEAESADVANADERARRGDVAVDHWDSLTRGEDPTES